ncbi:hypothetical protein MNBD_PLANCTO02-621, partial [hydrothermal vent metagenome]
DLGTVFGIAVDEKGTSVTQVFRGVVNTSNRHFSVSNDKKSSLLETVKLMTNNRILYRTDGTSTQEIKNLAEFFFVNFDQSNSSSNKNHIAELIGIDKITAENLRKQQKENKASTVAVVSLEANVLLSNKKESKADATFRFYNSFDNELAIEMGGAIKNAKSGPQFANLTYEDGGVLIKEGSRLSFETAGKLNNKKGRISFRVKPNWDGATDKGKRLFLSSGEFKIGKWYGGPGSVPKSYLIFRLHDGDGIRRETGSFYKEPNVVGTWKKGTWHTIVAEWDLTLPPGQQYMTLTVDNSFTGTNKGTWNSVHPLNSTFVIGANRRFKRSANALFDKIQMDTKPKKNK